MQALKCFMKIKKQSISFFFLYLVPIFGYFQIIQENDLYIKTNKKTIIYYEKFGTTERGLGAGGPGQQALANLGAWSALHITLHLRNINILYTNIHTN